jgi:hypothetical protein
MNKLIVNFQKNINSVTMIAYLFNVILIALLYNNPLITGVVWLSLLVMSFLTKRDKLGAYLKFSGVIFLVTVLFNLILNQRGTTLLLNWPWLKITTESLGNGIILGISFVNLLWAFYLYNALARTKVIFEVLSKFFKSIAIIFILTIKFIPRIVEIFTETKNLQKFRLGESKGGLKQTMSLTEIVLNKAMGSFMNVSDSLLLKGYEGRQKKLGRTEYQRSDFLILVLIVIAVAFNFTMVILKVGQVNFGSAKVLIPIDWKVSIIAVINCGLIILPLILGGINYGWWKFYVSKTTTSATITAKRYR